jgi:hypothetical protein
MMVHTNVPNVLVEVLDPVKEKLVDVVIKVKKHVRVGVLDVVQGLKVVKHHYINVCPREASIIGEFYGMMMSDDNDD